MSGDPDPTAPLNPQATRSLFDLGCQLLREGVFEDAARAFQRRLRLVPEDSSARYLLGVAALRMGDARRAAAELSLLPSPDPLNAATCFEVGLALQRQDEEHQAREWFARALTIDPQMHSARYQLLETRTAQTPRTAALPPSARPVPAPQESTRREATDGTEEDDGAPGRPSPGARRPSGPPREHLRTSSRPPQGERSPGPPDRQTPQPAADTPAEPVPPALGEEAARETGERTPRRPPTPRPRGARTDLRSGE